MKEKVFRRLFFLLNLWLGLASLPSNAYQDARNHQGPVTIKLAPTALQHSKYNQEEYIHHEHTSAVYAGIDALRDVSNFEHERRLSRHSYARRRTAILQENVTEQMQGGSFESFQTAPLSQGIGTHYATVWVGTPSQPQTLIVDTGSHLTAFPCDPCQDCGVGYHSDKYFSPRLSSTFEWNTCAECSDSARCSDNQCSLRQSYAEGSSWNAVEGRDLFFVGFNHPSKIQMDSKHYDASKLDKDFGINFIFGCQNHLTGLFIQQLADGIMGMGVSDAILPVQMMKQGVLEHSLFSMCFRRDVRHDKDGITAGVLTLGGINPILQKSPMVYARMGTGRNGWYDVRIKKILLRKGGGESARNFFLDREENLFVFADDTNILNGVIVDSGTTDTYFPSSLSRAFKSTFKSITGYEISNQAMHLTAEEVLKLPTILVVMESFDGESSTLDPETTVGLAGKIISPSTPQDVILAIPASHYMEYSPSSNTFTPRVYFTERSGGVLGANSMMGHDIVFDAENKRVGFAESDCNYDELVADAELTRPDDDDENAADEDGERPKCKLGEPSMSASCVESVDVVKCFDSSASPDMVLAGQIKYTRIIENEGFADNGGDCQSVALEPFANDTNPKKAICNDNGVCTIMVGCEMKCKDVKTQVIDEEEKEATGEGEMDVHGDQSDPGCAKDSWSECLSSCEQSRIISTKFPDGVCHVTGQEMRQCHIDACGKGDPCLIPFLVHAIIGLDVEADDWHKRRKVDEDIFIDSFVATINSDKEQSDILFTAGDVKVLSVGKWFSEDPTADTAVKGMKIVLEISLYNSNAIIPDLQGSSALFGLGEKTIVASCTESDIYIISSKAISVHNELERTSFMIDLINKIQSQNESDLESSVFFGLDLDGESDVISSWTIKTEVKDSSIHFTRDTVKKNFPFFFCAVFILLMICIVGVCCGSACTRRKYEKLLIAKDKLMERSRKKQAEKEKGEYAAVGIDFNFENDSHLEMEGDLDEFENNP